MYKPNDLSQFVTYAKKFCVALLAALAILATALSDGAVTSSEWLQVVIAFIGAAGVYQVENKEIK